LVRILRAEIIWIERGDLFPPGSTFSLSGLQFQRGKHSGRIERKLPMHRPTALSTATLPLPKLISQSHWRRGFATLPLVVALGLFALSLAFTLSLTARAVTPAPDGGYPNQNTAEGTDALFSLTNGSFNTVIGFEALYNNMTGDFNTAIGFEALLNNTTGPNNTAIGVEALFSNTTGPIAN
jgi:hypothetical protein